MQQLVQEYINLQLQIYETMQRRLLPFLLLAMILNISLTSAQNSMNVTDAKGLKQGHWEKKDATGRLLYKGSFKDNIPDGEFTYYDSTGKVKAVTKFTEQGSKAYAILYEKGKKISEGLYINEKKHGNWKYYKNDTVVIAEELYKNGVPDGTWKTYYDNGTLLEEVIYINGVKEGPWLQYFYDGLLKTKATYKNGKLEGLATFYHPNGRVFISGPYVNNLKDGIWMHMNDKGVAEKREVWSAGFLMAEEYYDKKIERMMKEEK